MSAIKFNLKNKQSNSDSLILMIIHVEGNRIKLSTSLNIEPKFWNDKKQRVKALIEFPDHAKINAELKAMEDKMTNLLQGYVDQNYTPDAATIKQDFFSESEITKGRRRVKSCWVYFEEFVVEKRKTNPDVRDYDKALRKHLLKTEERMGKQISFEMISNSKSNFVEVWKNYLAFEAPNAIGEPGLSVNTIGKQNKNLKVFLNWVFDQNIHPKFSLKPFPTVTEEVDNVYITEEELKRLENLDLEIKFEQEVRDLFLIGCETAFRFSDFIRIDKDLIREGKIHFRPKKTENTGNNLLIIPISSRLQRVLDKYDNVPPRYDANRITLFNSTLHLICKKAKIDSNIIHFKKRNGVTQKEIKKKYEEITSHTCRRTFCTLKFLNKMPAQAIMKFSGHKTERNFLKYLKLDVQLTADTYAAFF